ncbi:hypothetical protein TNCV_651841 [Trichonephila clavipes]|nr:hypothetical protein TNCV_651841 [Trichonephila clavipes]
MRTVFWLQDRFFFGEHQPAKTYASQQRLLLPQKLFDNLEFSKNRRFRSDIQWIVAGGRYSSSWHDRRAGRPHPQSGEASGGILPKSHAQWLSKSNGRFEEDKFAGARPAGSSCVVAPYTPVPSQS